MEEWVRLDEFPTYKISDLGNVMNAETGRSVAKSLTKQGGVKVGLVLGGKQYTRSVAVLVAKVFVPGYDEVFNTPIHLDNDQQNCEATNLAWRPRWYAYKYHQQFTPMHQERIDYYSVLGPVIDYETRTIYATVMEAAMANGLLMMELHINAHEFSFGRYGYNFPTNQRFLIDDQIVFRE